MGSARSLPGTRRRQACSQDTQRRRRAGELMGHGVVALRAWTSFLGFPEEAARAGGVLSPCRRTDITHDYPDLLSIWPQRRSRHTQSLAG